jgi:adsorption protein B
MLLHEERRRVHYDIVVTHDAEDLIHPDALEVLSNYGESFDMVQIPVLPLPTPVYELVHGIYCDEFAEFQMKDMPVRRLMGSFTPSSGVGTGYSRAALEKLAATAGNRVFEPACLTEDYENGMRLHELECPQMFVPLRADAAKAVATREYFPRRLHAAIRQRTRWVTGIALQTWERHGWRGSAGQRYWFWRDRKGLIGNPLSLAANLVFLWGLAGHFMLPGSASVFHRLDGRLIGATFALMVFRTAIRMACVGRLYGVVFALGVPVRGVCANLINSVASFGAMFRFAKAKIRNEPLVWLKTEHGYPSRNTLLVHKRTLREVLTRSGYITTSQLEEVLRNKPSEMRLGGYLVLRGIITEEELCEALSLQQGLPAGIIEPGDVAPNAARALPIHVVRNWRVLPFRIAEGSLHLATPEVPTDEMARDLRGFTGLDVRFQLVTIGNFEKLLNLL